MAPSSLRFASGLALALALATLAVPAAAHAGVLYVAPDGHDDPSAMGDQAHPFHTIPYAVAHAQANDSIYLAPGTYAGFASGTVLPPGITLETDPCATQLAQITVDTATSAGILFGTHSVVPSVRLGAGASGWTLRRLAFTATPSMAGLVAAVAITDGASNTTVEACAFQGAFGPAVLVAGASTAHVVGNTFAGVQGAVAAIGATHDLTVAYNRVENASVFGIVAYSAEGAQQHLLVDSNLINGIAAAASDEIVAGIGLYGVNDARVVNNGLLLVGDAGIWVGDLRLGLTPDRTQHVAVLHNTVVIADNVAVAFGHNPPAPMYLGRATDVTVANNILLQAYNAPVYITYDRQMALGATGQYTLRANLYRTSADGTAVYAAELDHGASLGATDTAQWQAVFPNDLTVSGDPTTLFRAGSLGHLAARASAVNAGDPQGVPVDVDGQPRNDGHPDIGFDELDPVGGLQPDAGTGETCGSDAGNDDAGDAGAQSDAGAMGDGSSGADGGEGSDDAGVPPGAKVSFRGSGCQCDSAPGRGETAARAAVVAALAALVVVVTRRARRRRR